MSCCWDQRKDRTRNKRPPALATIVPRAGREAGSAALNVIVDIAKDEAPYVGAKLLQLNEKSMAGDKIKIFCKGTLTESSMVS